MGSRSNCPAALRRSHVCAASTPSHTIHSCFYYGTRPACACIPARILYIYIDLGLLSCSSLITSCLFIRRRIFRSILVPSAATCLPILSYVLLSLHPLVIVYICLSFFTRLFGFLHISSSIFTSLQRKRSSSRFIYLRLSSHIFTCNYLCSSRYRFNLFIYVNICSSLFIFLWLFVALFMWRDDFGCCDRCHKAEAHRGCSEDGGR